jgi:hypothetical protein
MLPHTHPRSTAAGTTARKPIARPMPTIASAARITFGVNDICDMTMQIPAAKATAIVRRFSIPA